MVFTTRVYACIHAKISIFIMLTTVVRGDFVALVVGSQEPSGEWLDVHNIFCSCYAVDLL